MKKVSMALGVSLLFGSQVVLAEDAEKGDWKGEAELGLVTTTGNTETETVNGKAKVSYTHENCTDSLSFEGLKTSDDLGVTAKKVASTAKMEHKFGEHNYFFILMKYENDAFSGFDYQTSEAVGYGRLVIEEKNMLLKLEIGPGARQSKLLTGGTDRETTVWAGANYEWAVSKTSKFTEVITFEAGEDSNISKSVTALTSQIAGSLAMKVTYTVKNNSEVPLGVEKKDTETALTLIYSF